MLVKSEHETFCENGLLLDRERDKFSLVDLDEVLEVYLAET